jgi:hypothetical protein
MQNEINMNMSAIKAVQEHMLTDICLGGAGLNLNWGKDYHIGLAIFHSPFRGML